MAERTQPVKVKAQGFNLTAKDFDELYSKEGDGKIASYLTDGEHVPVKCSNCNKLLCEAWITQPEFEMTSFITAYCPFCGDKSFKVKVEGAFHLGHTEHTTIDHMEQDLDLDEEGKLIQEVTLQVKEG